MNNSPVIGVNFETKTRYKMERRKKKFSKMNFATSRLTRTAPILLLNGQ
jgi:hypothetical protein